MNVEQCTVRAEAPSIIEAWRVDCITHRPHSSRGHLTPSEFVRQHQEEQDTEEVACSP